MNVWYVQQNSFGFFECFGTLWALNQFFSVVKVFNVFVKVTLNCKWFRTKFAHQWLFTNMLQHMTLTHWPLERFRAYPTLFLVFFVHFRMSQETLLLIEYLLAYITFKLFILILEVHLRVSFQISEILLAQLTKCSSTHSKSQSNTDVPTLWDIGYWCQHRST